MWLEIYLGIYLKYDIFVRLEPKLGCVDKM